MTEEFDEDVVFEVCITAAFFLSKRGTDALSRHPGAEVEIAFNRS